MNTSRLTRFLAIVLSAALALPVWLAAPAQTRAQNTPQPRYKLVDLGTFGGPQSFVSTPFPSERMINSRGEVVGIADTAIPDPYNPNCLSPDCSVAHAFVWQKGVLTDLEALGDPNANSSFAFWASESGLIVGYSENGSVDPLTGNPEADAVLWQAGRIIDLGTLGGTQSAPAAVNSRGQVVGCALNAITDPFSYFILGPGDGIATVAFPGTTQMHAFLWQDGEMLDLGTLGGPDSCAVIINERGQIAGESYLNSTANASTGTPTQDPFLWDKGRMTDLGNLGGTMGAANGLNNRGQVVGTMTLPGDATFHPFFWDRGTLTDLGTFGGDNGQAFWITESGDVVGKADLPGSKTHHGFFWRNGTMTEIGTVDGDPCSAAYSVNSGGQVAGSSGKCGFGRLAILWEGGSIFDLNTLVTPPSSGLKMYAAISINDRGEIVAYGRLPNGNNHVVLLIPVGDADAQAADAWNASHPVPPGQGGPHSDDSAIPCKQHPGRGSRNPCGEQPPQ